MFEQITILLSFVFAIALTHLLSSTTDLILTRDRVHFSGLLALWMLNALIGLVVNWLSIWQLHIVKQWTVADVLLQFAPALLQYFACSLVSIRAETSTAMDMPAFYARQRPAFTGAFAVMMVVNLLQNYVYRDSSAGIGGNDWMWEDLLVTPMLAAALIGGWSRPVWLQWAAGLVMGALETYFLVTFAIAA
ncbi:MAG TPA: hypothetical protein VFC47_13855 [Caulobacteraceae bacterium]|nr:hypothetical protein [Caulobacteraceae bacterium]